DHLQLANALADALEDSHCHVCHVSALYSHLWHYSFSAIENESISLADIRFKSRLIVPDLRPPIPSLIS
uniref:hypothetical protein n=1 Tax=Enterococcus faecium TaxID=1352 RepID=UPI0034E9789B